MFVAACADGSAPSDAVPDVATATATQPDAGPTADVVAEPEPPSSVGFIQRSVDGPDGVSLPIVVWYPAHGPVPKRDPRNYLGLLKGAAGTSG